MKKSKLEVYLVIVPEIETDGNSHLNVKLTPSLSAYVHRTRTDAEGTQELLGGLLLKTTADALVDMKGG